MKLKAFNYVLDLAYGRKGKLKWELMEVRQLHYMAEERNLETV